MRAQHEEKLEEQRQFDASLPEVGSLTLLDGKVVNGLTKQDAVEYCKKNTVPTASEYCQRYHTSGSWAPYSEKYGCLIGIAF